jgi:hypothetical protein
VVIEMVSGWSQSCAALTLLSGVLALLLLACWRWAAKLRSKLESAEQAISEVKGKYDAEVRWRLSAERYELNKLAAGSPPPPSSGQIRQQG